MRWSHADVVHTVNVTREYDQCSSRCEAAAITLRETAPAMGGIVLDLGDDAQRARSSRPRLRISARRRGRRSGRCRSRDRRLRTRFGRRRHLAHRGRRLDARWRLRLASRQHGLACDNLVGAEVVLANVYKKRCRLAAYEHTDIPSGHCRAGVATSVWSRCSSWPFTKCRPSRSRCGSTTPTRSESVLPVVYVRVGAVRTSTRHDTVGPDASLD